MRIVLLDLSLLSFVLLRSGHCAVCGLEALSAEPWGFQSHSGLFCLPVFASVKTAPLNVLVLVQGHMFKHFSLGKHPEMELLGYRVSACSNLTRLH